MNNADHFSIGVDFGTDSVRALIVNADTGEEVATHVASYPRWQTGKYCNPGENRFRQHPLDYLEAMEECVTEALNHAGEIVRQHVIALSVDTTGSTPVAVDKKGVPLALKEEFMDNPNAMFILWKDHTAIKEAEEINRLARTWGGEDYTKFEGGIYSSEWFWAKILHVLRIDERIREAAYSWVEHCDYIPALLTGRVMPESIKRSRCAAGHKAMWHEEFDGLPNESFLNKLDPLLDGLRERLYRNTHTCDEPVGTLSPVWAGKFGLHTGVVVGTGAFDAHLGAVGGGIEPYYLSKVMGTSTCDMMVVAPEELKREPVKGICGQVDGSIVPGLVGLEAGQSAFGDVYAWFSQLLQWPLEHVLPLVLRKDDPEAGRLRNEIRDSLIDQLSDAASKVSTEQTGAIALDWLNGRRSPDANQTLAGCISGIKLGTDAPAIFRALVEATAFGARAIVERFVEEGVKIDGVIALGGVAKKSPFVMQVVTDVLNRPIKVVRSEQAVALGAAMAASVACGYHPDIETAQRIMGSGYERTYNPDQNRAGVYNDLYMKYLQLGRFIEHSNV